MAQGKTKGAVSLYDTKVRVLRELLNTLPDDAIVTIGAKWYDRIFKPTSDLVLVAPSDIGFNVAPVDMVRSTSIIPPAPQPKMTKLVRDED